jgi:hypothetical protein
MMRIRQVNHDVVYFYDTMYAYLQLSSVKQWAILIAKKPSLPDQMYMQTGIH